MSLYALCIESLEKYLTYICKMDMAKQYLFIFKKNLSSFDELRLKSSDFNTHNAKSKRSKWHNSV